MLETELGVLEEDGSEKSMCDILAEVRARLGEIPEHMRWALNEVGPPEAPLSLK